MKNENENTTKIINKVLPVFPKTLGIYLFGSYLSEYETPESDVDIAILLPVETKICTFSPEFEDLLFSLINELKRDVDLINLRQVDTVFQHEIIQTGILIYCSDTYLVEEFEMLTMSYYQLLNQERAEILQEITESGLVLSL